MKYIIALTFLCLLTSCAQTRTHSIYHSRNSEAGRAMMDLDQAERDFNARQKAAKP
jgi:hypothetical protein